jgi:hypothetical protein
MDFAEFKRSVQAKSTYDLVQAASYFLTTGKMCHNSIQLQQWLDSYEKIGILSGRDVPDEQAPLVLSLRQNILSWIVEESLHQANRNHASS